MKRDRDGGEMTDKEYRPICPRCKQPFDPGREHSFLSADGWVHWSPMDCEKAAEINPAIDLGIPEVGLEKLREGK